jgi:hypothetical protein
MTGDSDGPTKNVKGISEDEILNELGRSNGVNNHSLEGLVFLSDKTYFYIYDQKKMGGVRFSKNTDTGKLEAVAYKKMYPVSPSNYEVYKTHFEKAQGKKEIVKYLSELSKMVPHTGLGGFIFLVNFEMEGELIKRIKGPYVNTDPICFVYPGFDKKTNIEPEDSDDAPISLSKA